ncbi:hypothetical protein QTP88_012009 [Uroleucon formosanum]
MLLVQRSTVRRYGLAMSSPACFRRRAISKGLTIAVKSGRKRKDIAEEFGIPASTLSTIIKKKIDLNFPIDRKTLPFLVGRF